MIAEPRCTKRGCKHYQGISSGEEEKNQMPICGAFPKGIPEDISYGRVLHLEVREDQDNEIVFEEGENMFQT